jgi:hypothetical protein
MRPQSCVIAKPNCDAVGVSHPFTARRRSFDARESKLSLPNIGVNKLGIP